MQLAFPIKEMFPQNLNKILDTIKKDCVKYNRLQVSWAGRIATTKDDDLT